MKRSAVARAYAICEAIARDRACATKPGVYGDGYRSAAEHIAEAIHAVSEERRPTMLESELRDGEVQARTFARVVAAAVRVVADVNEDTTEADAVRRLIAQFFVDGDLPGQLQRREPVESTTSLISSSSSRRDGKRDSA